MFLPNWRYDGVDPGLKLFTLANEKLPDVVGLPFVFEVGCCDTDFLERVAPQVAYAYGIDWRIRRGPHPEVIRGDVLTHVFDHDIHHRPDATVALSAIEHVGLGHYDMDPVDVYGDVKALQRLRDHAAAGGFIYFDVPYAPEGYYVDGTKCRVYDDQALRERFGPHEVLGYTLPSVNGWIEKPEKNCTAPKPYYYVAILIRS